MKYPSLKISTGGYIILEDQFNRALQLSFSKNKILFITSLFWVLAAMVTGIEAMKFKITLMLGLLPFVVLFGFVFASSVFIARIYYKDVKNQSYSWLKVFLDSVDVLFGALQASLPFTFMFVVLAILFYLVDNVISLPYVGSSLSVLLAFAPVFLILFVVLLAIASILWLYFLVPIAAFEDRGIKSKLSVLMHWLSISSYRLIKMFLIASLPLVLLSLTLALVYSYAFTLLPISMDPFSIAISRLLALVPLSFVIAPTYLFFIHFSIESYYAFKKDFPPTSLRARG